MKWEREAIRTLPGGGRHRKNTYASETPFTDGERIYASFGQNVGLFCFTMDGTLLWKKQWTPQPIYLDFGTASSPIVHNGRVYLVHDNEKSAYITALDAKTGAEIWTTARPGGGQLNSSWMTPFVWTNPGRSEIVTTGQGLVDLLRSGRQGTVAPRRDGDADRVGVCVRRLAIRRHRLAGGCQPSADCDQARRLR